VPYCSQFSNLFEEKKNWAALPLVNTYFSLAPPSRIASSKIEKIEKVCGQTSFQGSQKELK
jgi:hypothetical protein